MVEKDTNLLFICAQSTAVAQCIVVNQAATPEAKAYDTLPAPVVPEAKPEAPSMTNKRKQSLDSYYKAVVNRNLLLVAV